MYPFGTRLLADFLVVKAYFLFNVKRRAVCLRQLSCFQQSITHDLTLSSSCLSNYIRAVMTLFAYVSVIWRCSGRNTQDLRACSLPLSNLMGNSCRERERARESRGI